ncbi:MAG: polysaccharide biosynthesis C-terminal domain-containing protein, partial [Candidatus Thermoplasmatota archaeon]|nr:polysaccharide biosynthesis C-terminal domain-containing protein [Candidatus Thermoplasmatota archaeon]
AGYIFLIPQYGMVAAAWLTVASETAVAAAATWFSLRVAPNGLAWGVLLKSFFAALVMALAILPLKNLWLPIPIMAGVIVYSVLVVVTGAVSKDTLKEIFAARRGEPTIDNI